MTPHARRTQATALLALAALAVGCAEERPPINRVQPNAIKKSFFLGEDIQSSHDDPEFWAQGTLIDVGYGASQDGLFTSTYAQPMTRVKWVVQEDLLVARLTYERISNSDGKGVGPASKDGQIVAAYRILSHFDIKRDYNPSTGEETNVVGENTVDRPWFEREFIRVDWSKNLNTDAYDLDTLAQLGIYGGVDYEPLAYYVNDPTDPNAPHFDEDGGYFDVTVKAFARPKMIDLSHFGWGIDKFPACWLENDFMGGSAPAGNCNPVELTIRQSFRRVEDRDYEPAHWDGERFQSFGAFTSDRYGFSRNYGMTDTQWHRFINRYNIWKLSHYYADPAKRTGAVACFTPETTPPGADPDRDLDGDGTADECAEVGRGSRCDKFSQKCTLPYRDREAVAQPWYYSNGSDPFYFEGTEWAVHDWDVAMRGAVQSARYAECKRAGDQACDQMYPVYTGQMDDHGDAVALAREVDDCRYGLAYEGEDCDALAVRLGEERGYSRGVIELARLPEMIVLCHSPVEANDPEACGGPRLPKNIKADQCIKPANKQIADACAGALQARPGDLRFHLINIIQTPQTPSPWGIMVDAHDPLTGEKVSASINTWSQITDLWSQQVIDLARYVRGELSTADVTEGTYVRDWAAAADAAGGGALGRFTAEEKDRRLADFFGISLQELNKARERSQQLAPDLKEKLAKLERDVRTIRADAKVPSSTRAVYDARRERAKGTNVEAELTTRMMQEMGGVSGFESSKELFDRASPFRGNAINIRSEILKRRDLALAERGACIMHEAPAPVAIVGLASLLEAKFGAFNPNDPKHIQLERAERMRRYVAQRAHYSVTAHEIGHSIGLRHNFVSSSDAFNYRPQYWQLRTDNGTNSVECTELDPTGQCVGPRWFDPMTKNEKDNLLQMFMQSSVMDYAGEAAQDFLGLGAYDFAATRMFYGDTVAVHAHSSYRATLPRGVGVVNKLDNFGGLLGFQPTIGRSLLEGGGTKNIHYSQLQANYDLIGNCKEVDPMKFKPARWDDERDGQWDPLLDGFFVKVNGKYTRCRQQEVDYVPWESLRARGDKSRAVDEANRTRVPYGFATDRWADLGNLAVYRHDNGADPYELFDFLITQQETMHIFDNYRRNRQTFSVRGAAGRALGRYNEKLRDGAKGIGLLVNIYKDFSLEVGWDFNTLWPLIVDESFSSNMLASSLVFDHFTRILQRPQAGEHYLDNATGVLMSLDDSYASNHPTDVVVPNGATGMFGNVSFGGRPLENSLATDRGEYDSEYTLWAGSYYEKAYTAMLMTESVDNFISSSRNDFLDARFRAISFADVFPEGYRRWLATNLTGDTFLKGPRLAANAQGRPQTDAQKYPTRPIGWTSWWPKSGPETCFGQDSSLLCTSTPPANTLVLDPQVGWEQQKFLIAWTLLYLPENEKQDWLNELGIWEIGADTDPGFANRIELHTPHGATYVARTFGKETIFGKTVQRGIAARMLEYANELMNQAYETDPGDDIDGDGQPDWYLPKRVNGQLRVKWDPTIKFLSDDGRSELSGIPGCNETENNACTCSSNRACVALSRYVELPFFMRQTMAAYGLAAPSMRGIY